MSRSSTTTSMAPLQTPPFDLVPTTTTPTTTIMLPMTEPSITPPQTVQFVINVIRTTNATALNTTNDTLVGFPAFCHAEAISACSNASLKDCNQCSMVGAGFFAAFALLLAFAIVLANLSVIVIFLEGKSIFKGSYGKIKVSLAVADLLTGLLLIVVALPNLFWTINATSNQLLQYVLSLQGSPLASAGGFFYLLIHTASLYHLVFLGQQRLFAVRWPIRYKQQNSRNVYIGLAVVWGFSVLCAVSPLWFPSFVFGYQHLIFLFNLSLVTTSTVIDYTPLVVMVVIVFILPYVVMTLFSFVTGYYVYQHLRKSAKMKATDQDSRREFVVFATMATMQIGFTLTMVPLIVVVILSYTGQLNSTNIATPYIICFYLSMANSLVNVLVYSAMDDKFRNSVKQLFCGWNERLRTHHAKPPSSKSKLTVLHKTTKVHTKSHSETFE